VAEGQVPPDEPTSDALEELGNCFLTIFWLSQHAFISPDLLNNFVCLM
jgi:hypothetical protein